MNSAVLGDLIRAGMLLALSRLVLFWFRLFYIFMRDVVMGLNLLLVLRLRAFSLTNLFCSAYSCDPGVSIYLYLKVTRGTLELIGLINSVS